MSLEEKCLLIMKRGWGLLIITSKDDIKSAALFVEFTQVQYHYMSEIVQFVKTSIIVISVHLKISTLFVISHFLNAKVLLNGNKNPVFQTQKKCPFTLIGDVSWIEVYQRRSSTVNWSGWIVLINSGTPVTVGLVWPKIILQETAYNLTLGDSCKILPQLRLS